MNNIVLGALAVILLFNAGQQLRAAEEAGPATTDVDGFQMTGMQRDPVVVETPAVSFEGMRRQPATRVLQEKEKKKN